MDMGLGTGLGMTNSEQKKARRGTATESNPNWDDSQTWDDNQTWNDTEGPQ